LYYITDEKQSRARGREKRKIRREKSRKERVRRKKMHARKGRKVAKHCVFPMICGSGGSKSRLAKGAGAEPAGQMRNEKLHAVVARSTFRSQNVQNTPLSALLEVEMWKKCTPLWREAHVEVKMLKTPGAQMSFRVAGVGHLKRICIDAFSVAGTVQKTFD